MGGPPKIIYSDDEGGMNNKAIMAYLDEHHIRHIRTRSHAGKAERTIRTIKAMLYARIELRERKRQRRQALDRRVVSCAA